MKRIYCLILSTFMLLSVVGCNTDNTENEKVPIKINMPNDNTVNGYKTDSSSHPSYEIITDKITVNNQISSNVTDTLEPSQNASYGGNKNSKKFHSTDCYSFKKTKDDNKIYLKNRDEFITQGYSPCKICNP